MNDLKHFGVLGMKWGIRKNREPIGTNYKKDSLVIKRGSELHRLSTIGNETHEGSGYASFLKKDSEKYREMGKVFSKAGMTQFDMTLKAKKDLVSPSQKERVDVFLEKMKDPLFRKELNKTRARMFILNLTSPQDLSLSRDNPGLSITDAKAYRLLNAAISGNKSLRTQYLSEFKKRNYDFILDETDANNKQAIAPIIFIERSDSFSVVNVEEL